MKPSIILLATLGFAVSFATPRSGAEPAEKAPTLDEALNRVGAHYRELNQLVNPPRLDREESVEPARSNNAASTAPTRRDANLQTGSGLQQGTLQPAAGLQGTSRGLTPESEWRRMFPKKPNGSPR